MNDTKEFVLFFKNNVDYSSIDIAKELIDRYPELGEPVILPDNGDARVPSIIFNKNNDIQIQATKKSVNILVNHVYFNKLSTIIFDIVDIFEDIDLNFYRIGYISSTFLSPNLLDRAKEKYLNVENTKSDAFNVGLYHVLDCRGISVNCWEKVIYNPLDFDDILMQYDFNTSIDEEFEFNMKNIKEFLKMTDEFMESSMNF